MRVRDIAKVLSKSIETLVNIITLGLALVIFVDFSVGMFAGSVRSELVMFMVAVAVMVTMVIMENRQEKRQRETAKGFYRAYRRHITATAIKFVNEKRLTYNEFGKVISVMDYTAKQHKWDQGEKQNDKY